MTPPTRVVPASTLAPSGRQLMQHLNRHLRTALHGLGCAHALLCGQALTRDAALQLAAADTNARLVTAYTERLLEYLEICGQRDTPGYVLLEDVLASAISGLTGLAGESAAVTVEKPPVAVELSALSAAHCRYLVRSQLESALDGYPGSRLTLRVSRRVVSAPTSWLVFDVTRLASHDPRPTAALRLDATPIGELRDLLAAALVDAIGGAGRRDAPPGCSRLVVPVAEPTGRRLDPAC
jgi:hypothetical protein